MIIGIIGTTSISVTLSLTRVGILVVPIAAGPAVQPVYLLKFVPLG